MVRTVISILLLQLLLVTTSNAKQFELDVRNGHKQVSFIFENAEKKSTLTKIDNGSQRVIKVNKKSSAFLAKKFQDLQKIESHDLALCKGRFVGVSRDKGRAPAVACLHSPLDSTKKMKQMAQLLDLTFRISK